MNVGFTGSRHGMNVEQMRRVRALLREFDEPQTLIARHGDCLGADATFHEICGDLGMYRIAHPPTNPKWRAFCAAEEVLEPKDYLVRNRDIVLGSHLMLATPNTTHEVAHSGTWWTIRLADELKVTCTIVLPDGRCRRVH